MIIQFLIIFSITYIGEAVSKFFNLSIPGTVLGMLFMFILLITGILKLNHIKNAADVLLINMAIFFIPPGVKLMNSLEILEGNWIKLITIAIITTVITMVVTGKVVEFFIKRRG